MALTSEHSPPVTQALVACRGCLCLATTGKMYCFETADLKKEFFNITGLEVSPGDGLPQHICHGCCGLLRKATEFRNKCHSTHALLSSHPVTLNFIQNIHGQPLHNADIVSVTFDSNSVNPQSDVESDSEKHLNNSKEDSENGILNSQEDTDSKLATEKHLGSVDLQPEVESNSEDHLNNNKEDSEDDLLNSLEDSDSEWATEIYFHDNDQSDDDLTTVDKVKEETKNCIPLVEIKSEKTEADAMNIQYTKNNQTTEKYNKMLHEYIQEKYVSKTFVCDSLRSECSKRIKLYDYMKEKYDYERKIYDYENEEEGSNFDGEYYLKKSKKYNFSFVYFISKEEQIKNFQARMDTDKYKKAKFKCTDCYYGFQLEHKYKAHRERHDSAVHGNYKCGVCKLRFPTKKARSGHVRYHKIRFTCNQCGESAAHSSKLLEHFNLHNSSGAKYECKNCSNVFNKKASLLQHVYRKHGTVPCGICHFMMSPHGIDRHMRRQHVKTFTCSSCNKIFNDYAAIQTHIHTSPNGVCGADAWPCTKCGVNCNAESDLRDHVVRCRRRIIIEAGPKKKKKKKTKEKREKREKGQKQKIMCEWCAQISPSTAHYRIHARMHTDERPYACPQCPKAFRVKVQLRRHMTVHTRERAHQCSQCGKAYTTNAGLWFHRRAVHETHRGHACAICSQTFAVPSQLRKHLNTVHMNDPLDDSEKKRNVKKEKKRVGSGVKKVGRGVKKVGRGVKKVGSDVKRAGRGVKKVGKGVKKLGRGVKSGEGCEESGEE